MVAHYLLSLLSLSTWALAQSHGNDTSSASVIDLSGSGWTLRSQNGSITVPGNVPSQQYIDLRRAGVIPDPLFGTNNTELTWVANQNWTYSRSISQLNTSTHPNTSTYLVFQGLDTFTTISLCGQQVASTENQFRQYIFDVSGVLRSCGGTPQLSINFGPAVPITHAISGGPDGAGDVNFFDGCNNGTGHEFSCKAYARKEQNDFGWDWSPSLVPAGPWRPIYAVQVPASAIYVNNAAIDVYRTGQMNNLPPDQSQPWVFNASIDFIGTLPKGSKLLLTLTDSGGKQIVSTPLSGVYASNHTITGSTTIDPSQVELWWPNGMGSQPLYHAKIDVIGGRAGPAGGIWASVERRVGFRTIVLNLGPITDEQLAQGIAPGANWHFEVNGQEFYAKGSNLVPPDVFWPLVTDTKVTQLFTLAKEAHMNLLRVWSSGAYLDDWIYDLADEMGLLLWSEFEFTDAIYPNNPRYLAEYEAEAYYNVRRVNHHPSLALWAGGNELESIILGYHLGPTNGPGPFADYVRIQEELLIKCVYANSKSISYIPSSTYNGYLSLDFDSVQPMIARYDNTSGPGYYYSDTDAYDYNASQLLNLTSYPVGRFADEFGFISMPSLQTWELEAAPGQLYYPSETVINHNRHTDFNTSDPNETEEEASLTGISQMTDAVQMYLPSPDLQDSRANFSAWCLATQIIHADAITNQIAFYRRGSGLPERQLGALFWQLNDLWATPSWASIEVTNRQKVLYYTAKDIFSPVIVAPYYNITTFDLQVWVTSDLLQSVDGTFSYQWIDWSGRPLSIQDTTTDATSANATSGNTAQTSSPTQVDFRTGAINSTQVFHYADVISTLKANSINATDALLMLSVSAGQYTHHSVFHPAHLVDVNLPDPGLVLTRNGNQFTVTATKAVAAWVWLEYDTNDVVGYWSTNAFWLNKGQNETVTFTVFEDSTNGAWVDTVSVKSVYDFTQT